MFRVVVPAHNSPWIARCVASLREQTYGDFTCVVIDDASSDRTALEAKAAARGDVRISVIRNEVRLGALQNILDGIDLLGGEDTDVIVTLDGDDWLASDTAFSTLYQTYQDPKVRLTFGQYWRYSSHLKGHCRPYPQEVQTSRSYRTYHDWHVSQPRTFRRELWYKVDRGDFLDPSTGKPWEMAWDLSMMFPMMEMCNPEEIVCIEDEILYIYNDNHGNNDWIKDMTLQGRLAALIRSKEKYPRVPA